MDTTAAGWLPTKVRDSAVSSRPGRLRRRRAGREPGRAEAGAAGLRDVLRGVAPYKWESERFPAGPSGSVPRRAVHFAGEVRGPTRPLAEAAAKCASPPR